jgi:GTP pyrophosphokinase
MEYAHIRQSELMENASKRFNAAETALLEKACAELSPKTVPFDQIALDTANHLITLGFGSKIASATLLYRATSEFLAQHADQQTIELAKRIQKINAIHSKNAGKIPYERLQKIVLAVSNDPRILVWGSCNLLQQLRFLSERPKEDQKTLSEHALHHWVPVIAKLGLHQIRWEIEDLAMKRLYPAEYRAIHQHIGDKRNARQQKMEQLVEKLTAALSDAHIRCTVGGRVKNFWRVYQKMIETKRKLSEIHDLIGARVIVDSVNECYEALAVIQNAFPLSVEGYDDYIAKPKKTGYQSIHANLNWKNVASEIQIRTWEMHRQAEEGRAAHWEYKKYAHDPDFDPQFSVSRQITDWYHAHPGILESLDLKLEQNKIFVFTPKNDIIELPPHATPIDFAYAVHSQLGNKLEKARVNGKLVPLEHQLQNGDTIEILISEKQTPKQSWLAVVQTEKARQKIRSTLHLQLKSPPPKIHKPTSSIQLPKNATILLARCCNPLPGDETVGHRTTKRKIKIHRLDCPNAKRIPLAERIQLEPRMIGQKEFDTVIRVESENRPGILSSILTAIAKTDARIISTEATTTPHAITSRFRIRAQNRKSIEAALQNLRKIAGVRNANRT